MNKTTSYIQKYRMGVGDYRTKHDPLFTNFKEYLMQKHIFVLILMASMFGGLQAQHLPQASYTPGTYTWNTGNYTFTSVTIRAWGAGAGGATGIQGNGGGGGGGSAFAERFFSTIGPNQTVTLVVGAGGLAGVPGGNFGQPGGDSYFVVTSQETRAGGGRTQSPDYSSPSTGGIPSGTRDKGFNGGGGAGRSGQRGGGGGSSAGTSAPGVTATGPDGAVAPVGGGNGGSSGVGPNDPAFPGLVPGGGGGGCQVQGGVGGDGLITTSYLMVVEEPPLPVELTVFNASLDGRDVHLAWSTASELNSWYYSVEHSADGSDFSEVGKVDAAGFSHTTQNYSYIHRPLTGGAHYYRLKMVDQDDVYKHSPLRVVQMNGLSAVAPFKAWSDGAQVWIEDFVAAEPGSFHILDMQGRILSRFAPAQGMDTRFGFKMPAVQGGIYLLRWQPASGAAGQTVKFLQRGF